MNNSVQIVIVLYKCSLIDSISFKSFLQQKKDITFDFELLIFNNDPELQIEDENFFVFNSPENVKVAGAYNFALKKAIESGKEWLLLLDQDTEIPEDYFFKLQEFLKQGYKDNLAAIVPVLKSGNKILSPKKVSPFLRIETNIMTKRYYDRLTAINSLSLIKVDFLKSLGGFKNEYQLDMLDRWLYRKIMNKSKLVYVLDASSQHNLSFLNFEKNVTPERYAEFIKIENKFISEEFNIIYFMYYKMKLFIKSILQLVRYKNKTYSMITFSYIFKK